MGNLPNRDQNSDPNIRPLWITIGILRFRTLTGGGLLIMGLH